MQELKKYLLLPLLIIGGLNWGLVGAFHFDLVANIFGPETLLARLVYIVVGMAALLYTYKNKKI